MRRTALSTGEGIFIARQGDPNLDAILETATRDDSQRVIGQRYLPGARAGDKRILLLDGDPIGAFLRRPPDGQARPNLHAGGEAVRADLDARGREICSQVGARCREEGLVLAGLDVIGGWLTEVNVTSPAGFRSLERLYEVRAEERLVAWIERAASRALRRGSGNGPDLAVPAPRPAAAGGDPPSACRFMRPGG